MDLGIFHQTLPGPTLNFEMDLSSTSEDIQLASDVSKPMQWSRPQGCQVYIIACLHCCGMMLYGAHHVKKKITTEVPRKF